MSYSFTKSPVHIAQLCKEIQDSSITIALDVINREGSDVEIVFKAELSSGEQATLAALVAAHEPDPSFDPPVHLIAGRDPVTQEVVPNIPNRYAGDGKLRVLSSHKPIIDGRESYNFFASAGDDQETGDLAGAELFMLEVSPGVESDSVALRFTNTTLPTEYIYIFGGGLAWENAGWGDTVSLEIRAEATAVVPRAVAEGLGLPVNYNLDDDRIVFAGTNSGTHALGGYPKWVPNYNNQGHWDLDTTLMQAVPASGSGYFDWHTEDVKIGDYVKNLLVYGTNYQYLLIDGTESAPLPYGTYFVARANNNSNTTWKAWGLMKMYRERLK